MKLSHIFSQNPKTLGITEINKNNSDNNSRVFLYQRSGIAFEDKSSLRYRYSSNPLGYKTHKNRLISSADRTNIDEIFIPLDLDLQTNNLFDLGVVDANGDNIFDIFTSNHSSLQNLELGDSFGGFTDVLSQWKLGQTKLFPGVEATSTFNKPPATEGLYIYRNSPDLLHSIKQPLNIQFNQSHNKPFTNNQIRGQIILLAPESNETYISIRKQKKADFKINERAFKQGVKVKVNFTLRPNGYLSLDTRFTALPYKFKLDPSIRLKDVYLGSQTLHPYQHTFTLNWRDRHGMAWVDYQGDGLMDVFMSRGGLSGYIRNLPSSIDLRDQFFLNQGNGQFREKASVLGFEKQGSRTRKVAWIDFNQDNRLDLYISGKDESRNQLFQQRTDGNFKNIAPKLGIHFNNSDLFEWLDVDNDGDQDLILARKQKLRLYQNQESHFSLHWQTQLAEGTPKKLAIADYDQDGDLDGYLASPRESLLLTNTGGRFKVTDPETVGLPGRGITANWVDYDNDGLLDLHVLPGQLYRQDDNHQFTPTSLLQDQFDPDLVEDARAAWFDLDNNGTRDVLYVVKDPYPQTFLYLNTINQNHWLQMQLVGPKRNRQAIGAKVIIETPDGKQQLQEVGAAEGSHFSQGHYRLYFGLGEHETIESVKIVWPDGTQQSSEPPSVDQLWTVTYPSKKKSMT